MTRAATFLPLNCPSYVDDVVGYPTERVSRKPEKTAKSIVAEDTNITYRWSGSAYVLIGSDLALGETSSTAYRGDGARRPMTTAKLKAEIPMAPKRQTLAMWTTKASARPICRTPWMPQHRKPPMRRKRRMEALDAITELAHTIDAIPTQSGSLIYTGSPQSPSWNSYNPETLDLSGTTEGTDAGEYQAIFTPKEG